ncbi:MAG: Trk system potassium transporter TrkA [Halobacteriales archaeon]
MRIVVIGAGEVGSSIAASLDDEHEIVVIDIDGGKVESLTYSHDVLAIEGDGTSMSVLEDADVGSADLLIACTDDDETNLVACSTASVLGNTFTIARVRNTNYLTSWRRAERAFGVDFMVCTNLLTAQTIVRIGGLPAALDVDQFAGGRIQMAEFNVAENSPVAGQTVEEADRIEGLTFAALIDETEVTIPAGDTVIDAGKKLIVIGPPDSVEAFAEQMTPEDDQTRDVVVFGAGDIGAETVRLLCERGVSPTVVEEDEAGAQAIADECAEATVLNHDPTDMEFLEREHVDKADLAIVALDVEERTLLVSLLVEQLGTRRTVSVVESGDYADLFEAVGVDVAINPRDLTAEEITRFTRERRTENVALIESDRAEVIEIEVTSESILVGWTLGEAVSELAAPIVVGAIARDGELITPRGETEIQPGDHVVIFLETTHRDDVLPML